MVLSSDFLPVASWLENQSLGANRIKPLAISMHTERKTSAIR